MRRLVPSVLRPDVVSVVGGGALVLLATMWSMRTGGIAGLGLLLGLSAFVAVLMGFIAAPHIAVAFTIPYFAALPMLKVLVSPQLAPTKDIIGMAAVLAAALVAFQRRAARAPWNIDQPLVVMTTLLVGLYLVNIGGAVSGQTGFGLAWFHGVRLVAEPLLLLLVGLLLNDARRTFRWALVSLIATACVAAAIGLLQQALGPYRLVNLGYAYGEQVRTIGGRLRSFGSFDQPFDYATVLALGLAGVLLWTKGAVRVCSAAIILAGLVVSFVRGAALSVAALIAIVFVRRGDSAAATLLLGAVAALGVVFVFASTQPTPGAVVQAGPSTYLTLNGRTKSWRVALGTPANWAFGRGVGAFGTAADRAARSNALDPSAARSSAADSGYLATLSDVGFLGLIVEIALFGRALVLLRRAVRRGEELAWVGIGFVTVLVLDALLRSSLTGFPTAHIAMLLTGLTLAATSGLGGREDTRSAFTGPRGA
jgi:hypothetical protein